jgi:hypothetical protein
MTPKQLRTALADMGLSQRGAARLLKIDERTMRKYRVTVALKRDRTAGYPPKNRVLACPCGQARRIGGSVLGRDRRGRPALSIYVYI